MNKNKKGFTLIEMLVVIAIIAILVAIIIPTVMSATEKAAAATNAANLRSVKAEATTNYLLTKQLTPYTNVVAKDVPSLSITKDSPLNVTVNEQTGEVTVTFGEKGIDDFVEVAGGVRSGTGTVTDPSTPAPSTPAPSTPSTHTHVYAKDVSGRSGGYAGHHNCTCHPNEDAAACGATYDWGKYQWVNSNCTYCSQ